MLLSTKYLKAYLVFIRVRHLVFGYEEDGAPALDCHVFFSCCLLPITLH